MHAKPKPKPLDEFFDHLAALHYDIISHTGSGWRVAKKGVWRTLPMTEFEEGLFWNPLDTYVKWLCQLPIQEQITIRKEDELRAKMWRFLQAVKVGVVDD